jgi:hypothetical protein
MTTINFILYLVAAICFLVAFTGIGPSRFNILALGLLAWVLVNLIATGRAL